MKVVVTSQKELKLEAVRNAFAKNGIEGIEMVGVKTESGVGEQPFDEETVLGARNRITDARRQIPDADVYVSMENGQFLQEDGSYLDKAALIIQKQDGRETVGFDAGLPITDPEMIAAINEAKELKRSGARDITATDLMIEKGLIPENFSKDPHQYIAEKPRSEFLSEGLENVVKDAFPNMAKGQPEDKGLSGDISQRF